MFTAVHVNGNPVHVFVYYIFAGELYRHLPASCLCYQVEHWARAEGKYLPKDLRPAGLVSELSLLTNDFPYY